VDVPIPSPKLTVLTPERNPFPVTLTVRLCPAIPFEGESPCTRGLGLPTRNELLVPEAPPPDLVATIVNVPVFWKPTVHEESTPEVNGGVVPAPTNRSPVELMTIPSEKELTALS